MMKNELRKSLSLAVGLFMLAACSSQDDSLLTTADDTDVIHVAAVSTDDMVTTAAVTRAGVAAETVDWLTDALKKGMDITYYKAESAKQKARLKLETDALGNIQTSDGGVTIYSLNAYDSNGQLTSIPAKWQDNGAHTFQGVFVPTGLKTQQSAHTYDDLTHYTAIPPSTKISATVGRITIPLQHRLARVVAYVLIDKSLNAQLKGYDKDHYNAADTKLRFCHVKTLDYVSSDGQPVWKEERKAIPNYLGEQNVTLYKDKSTGKLVFPTDDNWDDAHADYVSKGNQSSYTRMDYGSAPYYDLIVCPTYTEATTGTHVMYDEASTSAEGTNKIDFELTLDNDLEYEKQFVFDLNANDETVVYLRVSPERIDYNSTGARLWKESSYHDEYYGVNNQNGNNLSKTGGSWQRAYTNSTLGVGVTDGHYYDADPEDKEAQYVDDDKFVEMLAEAHANGKHHGDYFILQKDITIDLSKFDETFVFTGHLDALDHTITLTGATNGHNWLFAGQNGIYTTAQENDRNASWEANVHLEGSNWVPTAGWRSEIVNATVSGGALFKDRTAISGYVNNCQDANGAVENNIPALPTY